MSQPDYGALAERIASITSTADDIRTVLQMLGHEYHQTHEPEAYGIMAIAPGQDAWSAGPRLDSADDFEKWVLPREGTYLDDIGFDIAQKLYYVSYSDPKFGNDYGESQKLGAAMWEAFVRLVGEVYDDD